MAASARNTKYSADTVYGSLAYDYGREGTYSGRTDRPVDRQVVIPAAPRLREQTVAETYAKTGQSVAPLAVIGYICAAVLLVFTLMAKIQLTEVTDTAAKLEQQLGELKVAQNRLLIEYEKAFNLTEIEKYATRELGMQRPREEQLFYLSGAVPDKAVVLGGEDDGESFGDRLFGALSSIAEYFRQ
ncbi:MAG: cell division protein FtsL [Oscillospiraceae bacterium]|jgi:cell division protein FtsL|nr:cell division protein FtsL [Oscillospiraceae bacterium]